MHQLRQADEAPSGVKLRFFVLTTRSRITDFRMPLVEALQGQHETWHIWMKRRPQITGPGAAPVDLSFPQFLTFMRRVSTEADAVNVYLNSTSAAYPVIVPLMRQICGKGIWCHDMHDDLLYESTGLKRLQLRISVALQESASDLTVRAADSLKELFPHSHHLGNASQIGRLTRREIGYDRVLILASLDQRFDFGLMEATAAACPDTVFHVHGQISQSNTVIQGALDDLLKHHGNVIYHGRYSLADLEGILASYVVSFAPYRTNIRLTRYIDPLRFYHCLNSGMELITSRIPQAEQWGASVHLVKTAADVATALGSLASDDLHRRNSDRTYRVQKWQDRADRLVRLVIESPRFFKIVKQKKATEAA